MLARESLASAAVTPRDLERGADTAVGCLDEAARQPEPLEIVVGAEGDEASAQASGTRGHGLGLRPGSRMRPAHGDPRPLRRHDTHQHARAGHQHGRVELLAEHERGPKDRKQRLA